VKLLRLFIPPSPLPSLRYALVGLCSVCIAVSLRLYKYHPTISSTKNLRNPAKLIICLTAIPHLPSLFHPQPKRLTMASQTNKDTTNGETQQQPNQIPTLKLIPGQQQNVRVAVIGIISNGKGQVVAGRRIGPLGGGGSPSFLSRILLLSSPDPCCPPFFFAPSPFLLGQFSIPSTSPRTCMTSFTASRLPEAT